MPFTEMHKFYLSFLQIKEWDIGLREMIIGILSLFAYVTFTYMHSYTLIIWLRWIKRIKIYMILSAYWHYMNTTASQFIGNLTVGL